MELTREKLNRSKIIFNHVPKAGGTSLIYFFYELFGPEFCFRHASRSAATGQHSPPIQKVPPKELERYRFICGHFDYGNHTRFKAPSMYLGVMRDPFDRVASDYYFNKGQGRDDLKEMANRLSLEEYIIEKMNQPKSRLVTSCQVTYLSGQNSAEAAMAVIEEHYLACCTNEQLDDMQRMLARLYLRYDLPPSRMNVTKHPRENVKISAKTQALMNERFAEDYKLLAWVRDRFDREYRVQNT